MDEEIEELMRRCIQLIESKDGFVSNELELLKIDFESTSIYIAELEERIEELEEEITT